MYRYRYTNCLETGSRSGAMDSNVCNSCLAHPPTEHLDRHDATLRRALRGIPHRGGGVVAVDQHHRPVRRFLATLDQGLAARAVSPGLLRDVAQLHDFEPGSLQALTRLLRRGKETRGG